jgi:hypothetical protein
MGFSWVDVTMTMDLEAVVWEGKKEGSREGGRFLFELNSKWMVFVFIFYIIIFR